MAATMRPAAAEVDPVAVEEPSIEQTEQFGDERDNIASGDQVLLIVENDPSFAKILVEMAHDNQFKAIVTSRGASAIALARDLNPHAITLDINLPDIDGWRVLDRLKDELATRHIPSTSSPPTRNASAACAWARSAC